jgi:hypothetical protein
MCAACDFRYDSSKARMFVNAGSNYIGKQRATANNADGSFIA